MSFFNINGWNVPIVNGGMSETSTAFGNTGRSFTNRALINRRLLPRTWTGSMLFQSPSVADTVEGLVSGRGHHFPFDRDAWSDSGVGPTVGTIGNISVSQAGDARFGTGRAELSGDVSFDVGIPANKYTVILWVFSPFSAPPRWFQTVEVNDGITNDTYTDGVAGGVPLVSSVTNGVITLDSASIGAFGSVIDDLVILPFAADESFIQDLYSWQTADNMAVYCPFDYPLDYTDRIGGTQGTASSTSPNDMASGCQVSKSGEGSLFFSNDQDVTYGSANVPQVENDQSQTICFWVRPQILGGTQICAKQLGLPLFPSWQLYFDGTQMTATRGVNTTFNDCEAVDPNNSVDEEWVHFAAVYTPDILAGTATLSLYRNGALAASDSTFYAPGAASRDLVIGDSAQGLIGAIDDFRIYESALSASQIADVIVQGNYGYGPTLPSERAFSKMPRLLVSGDVIGSQSPKQVIGNVTSEPYVQHGGNYSTNDRAMEFTLQEVKKPRERGIPRPDANFILEPEFIRDEGSNEHTDAIGGYRYGPDGTNFPDLLYQDSFGFHYGFSGVDGCFSVDETIGNISTDLGGSTAVTVSAWFNAGAVASMGLVYLPISTTDEKLSLSLDGAGDVVFGGRDEAVAGVMQLTTSGSTYVAGEWYFVAGILDLLNEEIRVYSNFGASPQQTVSLLGSSSISPGQNYFSSENGDGVLFSTIGAEGDPTSNPFDGRIKSAALWKRALQEDEIVTVFRKGYDRRIFR